MSETVMDVLDKLKEELRNVPGVSKQMGAPADTIILPPGYEDAVPVSGELNEVVSSLPAPQQVNVKAQWTAARDGMMKKRKGIETDLDGKPHKQQPALRDEDIIKFAIDTLESMGAKFFVDAYPHIFLPAENRVYRFHDEGEAFRLLKRFGLYLEQKDYNLVNSNLHGIIMAEGYRTRIEKFGCMRDGAIYINGGDCIIKITDGPTLEESFSRVINGTDKVYVLNKHLTPWPTLDFDRMRAIETNIGGMGGKVTSNSKMCEHLNAYFEEDRLKSVQYQQLFILRYLALFLGEAVELRAIMLALGVQGSGKSTLFEKIMWLFFGPQFESQALPADLRSFVSAVTNHQILVFDNIDRAGFSNKHTDYPEYMDLMCKCSTGGTITRAQLYKDNQDKNYKLRSDIFLTARMNPFPSDATDLVRRIITLPIRTPTLTEHIDKEDIKAAIVA